VFDLYEGIVHILSEVNDLYLRRCILEVIFEASAKRTSALTERRLTETVTLLTHSMLNICLSENVPENDRLIAALNIRNLLEWSLELPLEVDAINGIFLTVNNKSNGIAYRAALISALALTVNFDDGKILGKISIVTVARENNTK
jgi:hypothetical protein